MIVDYMLSLFIIARELLHETRFQCDSISRRRARSLTLTLWDDFSPSFPVMRKVDKCCSPVESSLSCTCIARTSRDKVTKEFENISAQDLMLSGAHSKSHDAGR